MLGSVNQEYDRKNISDALLDAARSKSNALSTVGKPCFESDNIMMIAARLSSILRRA